MPPKRLEIADKLRAAEEIRCIRRCPAVKFAVSRSPKAKGRMKILSVSTRTNIGIKGAGAPSGQRWAKAMVGWLRNP